jgi:hypothetical protein
MNRAFALVLVPALLVMIGYVVVFRSMGVSPPYWLLSLAVILLVAALWWVGRRDSRKAGSHEQ